MKWAQQACKDFNREFIYALAVKGERCGEAKIE